MIYKHVRVVAAMIAFGVFAGCGAAPAATSSPTVPPAATSTPLPSLPTSAEIMPSATTNAVLPTLTSPSPATVSFPVLEATTTVLPTLTSSSADTLASTVTTVSSSEPESSSESEILFLRGGDLLAYGVHSRAEHILVQGVRAFAATSNGTLLAMLRGTGRSGEIWVAQRDGSQLQQVTRNTRAEDDLSWAPDGSALTYSSADSDSMRTLDWMGWSRWCAISEVRVLELADMQETTLASGCEPAFDPAGQRIAFASPPTSPAAGQSFIGAQNALRLINRQGQNGWDFAKTDGSQGHLVYAPAWTPAGDQLAYQRFVGYQALVDINLTEIGAAFKGDGKPLISGAGWMLPPQFAPNGQLAAVIEHNFSDARGGSGYEIWRLYLVRLGVASSMALPTGETPTVGLLEWRMPRVTAVAWSPDGASLALALPEGWSKHDAEQDLIYQSESAGNVWIWGADGEPQEQLISGVDYASPLIWLP